MRRRVSEPLGAFLFPQERESLPEWFERVRNHDGVELVTMFQGNDHLDIIAHSYDAQGFIHQAHRFTDGHVERPFFNILLIRDLMFVTYGREFEKAMGWGHER